MELARREAELNPKLPVNTIFERLKEISGRTELVIKKKRQESYERLVNDIRSQSTADYVSHSVEPSLVDSLNFELRHLIQNLSSNEIDIIESVDDNVTLKNKIGSSFTEIIRKYGGSSERIRNSDFPDQRLITRLNNASSYKKKRRLKYILAQRSFKKNCAAYANSLLDGLFFDRPETSPPDDAIRNQFNSMFEHRPEIRESSRKDTAFNRDGLFTNKT